MKSLATLIQREYWENRNSFLKTPAMFGVVLLILSIIAAIMNGAFHFQSIIVQNQPLTNDYLTSETTGKILISFALPFILILWLVVFYYFLNTLFSDRKDRSAEFFLSMPVSQTQMQISKLIAGMVIAPLCNWICIILTELIFLVILTIIGASLNIHPLTHFWDVGVIFDAWFQLLGLLYLQGLWLFPLFGWCLACSAFAKRSPFLTAVIPLVLFYLVGSIVTQSHWFVGHPTSEFAHYVFSRFGHALSAWGNLISHSTKPVDYNSLYWSLLVGAGLTAIAGILRFYCWRFEG